MVTLGYGIFVLLLYISSFTENIIRSFIVDPFSVFIVFGKLFLNFIVCIFGTVIGNILIVGSSSPEIELISVIVIECVLNSFWQHKLSI